MENFETGVVTDCETDDCEILSKLGAYSTDAINREKVEALLRIKYGEAFTKRGYTNDRVEFERRQRERKERGQLMDEIIRDDNARRERESASFNAYKISMREHWRSQGLTGV